MSIVGWDHTRGPAAMGRWLGTLYICGSTLSLVSLALPHWHQQDTSSTAICALLGYPAAALLFQFGARLPRFAFHLLLGLGTTIITLGVYFGHNAGGSLTASVFYIWVALYAFNFFSRPAATAHIAWIAVSYAVVLWIQPVPAGAAQWLLVVGTAVVSGLVVAALVEQVRSVARRDGLTGLWNRRALEEDLERLLATASREAFEVTFAILDIDHFKRCNDTLGHHGADGILMDLAARWTDELRPSDSLARFGGDEFAIVFRTAPSPSRSRCSNGCAAQPRPASRSPPASPHGCPAKHPRRSKAGRMRSCTKPSAKDVTASSPPDRVGTGRAAVDSALVSDPWRRLETPRNCCGSRREHPDREAYVHGEKRVTYAWLDRAADGFAATLLDLGVAPGDVVCLMLGSSIKFAACYLGALRAGAITSAINLRLGVTEQASILDRTEPAVTVLGDGAEIPAGANAGKVLHVSELGTALGREPRRPPPSCRPSMPPTRRASCGPAARPAHRRARSTTTRAWRRSRRTWAS